MLVITYKVDDTWHINKVEDFCWYYTDKVLYLLLNNNWHRICNVQYFKFIIKED